MKFRCYSICTSFTTVRLEHSFTYTLAMYISIENWLILFLSLLSVGKLNF